MRADAPRAALRELKSEVRKRIISVRDALPAAVRRDAGARITVRLYELPAYRDAHCVLAYMGIGSEFDTAAFVADVLARGKALVLPRVDRATRSLRLHAVRDTATDLSAGVWGIPEPRADRCPELTTAAIDFALVPGVAFTRRCERLGYGAGFYDRLIQGFAVRPALVAAAFSVQVVPELPVTPSDQEVDAVVTEDAEYQRRES
jgi:5-formyltetrahydrofolate cyclo-ligase